MKNQKSVFIGMNEFLCTQFFDVDKQCDCVDVKNESGNWIAEIVDILIPDVIDEDANIKFDERVEDELTARNLI